MVFYLTLSLDFSPFPLFDKQYLLLEFLLFCGVI